jgi:predicted membrane-bound dolichyl-phosphate-mannose-protein mannosyltransferase
MKFAMMLVIVLGILFAVPLVIQGIKYNEPGFWMLVGFVILGLIRLRYFMGKHTRDKAAREARPLKSPGER